MELTSSTDNVRDFAANGSVLLSPIRPLPTARSLRYFRQIQLKIKIFNYKSINPK